MRTAAIDATGPLLPALLLHYRTVTYFTSASGVKGRVISRGQPLALLIVAREPTRPHAYAHARQTHSYSQSQRIGLARVLNVRKHVDLDYID